MATLLPPVNSIKARLAFVVVVYVVITVALGGFGMVIELRSQALDEMQQRSQKITDIFSSGDRLSLVAFNRALWFRSSREEGEGDIAVAELRQALELYRQGLGLLAGYDKRDRVVSQVEEMEAIVALVSSNIVLIKSHGLHENDAVYGDFRQAARALETELIVPQDVISLLQLRRHEKDFLLRHRHTFVDNFDAEVDRLLPRIEDALSQDLLLKYQRLFHHYVDIQRREDQQFSQIKDRYVQRMKDIEEGRKLAQTFNLKLDTELEKLADLTHTMIVWVLPLAAMSIVVLQFYFTRRISIEVAAVASAINQSVDTLEQGRGFSERMATDGKMTELSDLADAFNRLIYIIDALLIEISGVAGNMLTVSSSTQQAATANSGSIQQQVEEISQLAQATSAMSTAAETMADTTDTASSMVAQSEDSARDGLRIMEQISDMSAQLSTEIAATTEVAREMDRLGSEVGGVMEVIRSITDQTNLLALNAAIEAARAGEVGRGFAVVADEVRSLAQKTADATVNNQQTIESVQSGMSRMCEAMEQSSERVLSFVELNRQASEALTEIVASAGELRGMNQHIASSAHQQSDSAIAIRESMMRIENSTQEIAGNTMKTTSDSGDLSQFSAILRNLVVRMQGGIEDGIVMDEQADDDVELF